MNDTSSPGSWTTPQLHLFSAIVSVLLLALLIFQWLLAHHHDPSENQITDMDEVNKVLANYAEKMELGGISDVKSLPTGIFIQSLSFADSSDVYMTGYIWQRFTSDLPSIYNPWKKSCHHPSLPWNLPDRVHLGADLAPRIAYAHPLDDGMLCGWFFESTIRQDFNYSHYPFDNTVVSLRLWFDTMEKNVVMVPDFAAYPLGTDIEDFFGINQGIVLDAWEAESTYFSYGYTESSNTNFGMLTLDLLNESPELNYNFVIKRRLIDSLVEHMLGIMVVLILLHATLLVSTRNSDRADRHGFTTAMVLGGCSALFFVVLLSHIQIRTQFGGTTIVYLEGFYYLSYLLLIGTTINAYLFTEEPHPTTRFIHYRDNLVPKVLYWPVTLTIAVAWTQYRLF